MEARHMKLIMAILFILVFLPATGLCQRTPDAVDYNEYLSFLKQMRQSDGKRVFRDYMEMESNKKTDAEKKGNQGSGREAR